MNTKMCLTHELLEMKTWKNQKDIIDDLEADVVPYSKLRLN